MRLLSFPALAVISLTKHTSNAFLPSCTKPSKINYKNNPLFSTNTDVTTANIETTNNEASSTKPKTSPTKPQIPLDFDEMIKQVSDAMTDAKNSGSSKTRQIIRILLPRDPESGKLGEYFENEAGLEQDARRRRELLLVPPDETWQGGIMQLYRAAAPTCQEILRRFTPMTGGIPPKILEDRSIDPSGADGIGLLLTQCPNPQDDVCCFVQPSQETIDAISTLSSQAGADRLVVLVNPQWRNVDDALDTYSKGGGVFGNIASFLGGKGNSLKRLEEMGYQSVYTLEGYVCKGGNVRLWKRFDSDWFVFAESDSGMDYILVGSMKGKRPSYQDVEKMLDDKGIGLKYARDMGMEPKL